MIICNRHLSVREYVSVFTFDRVMSDSDEANKFWRKLQQLALKVLKYLNCLHELCVTAGAAAPTADGAGKATCMHFRPRQMRVHKLHSWSQTRFTDYDIIPLGEIQWKKTRTGCKTPVLVVKAEACYLEHVCIAVMGVLHHHRLGSRQSVRDAVLVFVAYGLMGQRERVDENR